MRLIRIDGFSAGTVRKEGGEIKDKDMRGNAFFSLLERQMSQGRFYFLARKRKRSVILFPLFCQICTGKLNLSF